MHANSTSAPHGDDGVGHFEQEPGAVFDRAAVAVVALVGAVLQELIKQIAVRAVDLDTIEAGRFGVLGATAEGFNDAWDFSGFQGARRDISALRAN